MAKLKFLGISTGSTVALTASQTGASVTRTDESWGNAPVAISRLITPTTLNESTLSIEGGRVTTFQDATHETVDSVIITAQPTNGKVTVNPDHTIALVLTGDNAFSGALSFSYDLTRTGGSVESTTQNLSVSLPTQQRGWAIGDHYMLETDVDGKLIVETGVGHRKVYITLNPATAFTKADIAADAGVSEATVTSSWLISTGTIYGASEAYPLDVPVGMDLWDDLTDGGPTSHWVLFERGYDYRTAIATETSALDNRVITRGMNGTSKLNPNHVTSWGAGTRPVIPLFSSQEQTTNMVISDVACLGFSQLQNDYLIISHVDVAGPMNFQSAAYNTIRNSEITYMKSSDPTSGIWGGNLGSGVLMELSTNPLFENNFIHHNAWEDDYAFDGNFLFGMWPTQFNHNVYIQADTYEATFKNNIVSQGASFGVHFRGGGYLEDNLLLDNNIGFDTVGSNYQDRGWVGNYSFASGNITTSAGYKDADSAIGAVQWGMLNAGSETTWYNNLVAHLANPDDAAEQAWKVLGTGAYKPNETAEDPPGLVGTMFYDDTIVYNWQGSVSNESSANDRNTSGVTPAVADVTTIQRYADSLDISANLISDGTQFTDNDGVDTFYQSQLIEDLTQHWLTERRAGTSFPVATDVIGYFKDGFGMDNPTSAATTHSFIPNEAAEGVRWDNRINWSNNVVPSNTHTVDLRGNNVTTYATFDGTVLLNGGTLTIYGGKFSGSIVGPGTVILENAGQRDATLSGGATETDNR